MDIEKLYPGVYRFSFGEQERFSASVLRLAPPRAEKLNTLEDLPLPFGENLVTGELSPRGALVNFPWSRDEEIYGFGLQSGAINQAGMKRHLKINADAQGNTGNSHAAIPFFVSSRGYGVVLNTLRYTDVYCGSSKRRKDRRGPYAACDGVISAGAAGLKGLEGFIFTGKDAADCCRRYVLFSGGGAMPPLWGLGVWYRAYGKYNEKELIAAAKLLRDEDMPVTVLGIEPGWHSRAYPCTYKFDAERYGDYRNTLKALYGMGYRVNLWEHVFVHPESDIYEALLPWSGDYEVWGGITPDLLQEKAREIFGAYHDRYLLDEGISGFKCDECDNSDYTGGWSYPEHSRFPSGLDGEQMHSALPQLYQKVFYDLYRRRNLRTWGEVRAQHCFSAPYPFLLYSDWYRLNDYIAMTANSGFSGILYSPEIRTASGRDDLYRRMLAGVFSAKLEMNIWFMPNPMWKNYNEEGNLKNEILPDSAELADTCREFMRFRSSLVPYLYTAFYRYHTEGIPPVRALQMDYPECRGREQQGFTNGISFGDSIIAYPLTASQTEAKIFLPGGNWYCFFTKKRFTGNAEYTLPYPADRIPVFVREGAVVPLLENPGALYGGGTLKIKPAVYGNNAAGSLFTDDFTSFDFERGQFAIYNFKAQGGRLTVQTEGPFTNCEIGEPVFTTG
jgi:alpha-D-xyloside xylohydrolase